MRFPFARPASDSILSAMSPGTLHEFHRRLGASFAELGGQEVVADYGDWRAEHAALRQTAGVLDLSFRSRLCLVGNDRVRFLHGQVTNDVNRLRPGQGCYAALTTHKGKMESDLNLFVLSEEILLDFEPGLAEKISARLEKFIVADDVRVVNVAPHYGLLSVQGPRAAEVVIALGLMARDALPHAPAEQPGGLAIVHIADATLGEIYLASHARLSGWGGRPGEPTGFDLFVPNHSLSAVADRLIAAARTVGGRACGWTALETARIEAGIPRFGADMDETTFPQECGIEARAVSYRKGCYIGQEILNRLHTFGHVNRQLCGLRLADSLKALPARGDKLFFGGQEIGQVTSAAASPVFGNIALGCVRRHVSRTGRELILHTASGESPARIAGLPFTS